MVRIVKSNPISGLAGDRSSTVTVGGHSQIAISANQARRYLYILNPLIATESLFVGFEDGGSDYTARTWTELIPGASFEWSGDGVPYNTVFVLAASTGHAYTAQEII